MTPKTKAYQGTAQDIGCDVFIQHVMPIIRQASKQTLELRGGAAIRLERTVKQLFTRKKP